VVCKKKKKQRQSTMTTTRILVTGGCGFIGSCFVRSCLQRDDIFLVNIDRLYPCATRTLCENIPDKYVFVQADITEPGRILNLLLLYDINIVVGFAAQSHVDTSFSNPRLYLKDNVLGTQTILDALRECHEKSVHTKPRFIHISTDEVYGQSDHDDSDAKHEGSLLKPSSVYSATKACAEMLVHAYQCSYKIPAIIVRGNNAIGKGQYLEKCIPRFITLLQRNLPLTIQGDGTQRRSFIAVDDFVDAIHCVIQKGENGAIYNIGSDFEISILEVARTIATCMEAKDAKIMFVRDRNFNDKRYWIKSDALRALGWRQKISFEECIRQTIHWYLDEIPRNYFVENYTLPTPIQVGQIVPLFELPEQQDENSELRVSLRFRPPCACETCTCGLNV